MTTHRFTARAEATGDGRRMRARIVGWGDVGHPYDTSTGDISTVTVQRGGLVPAHDVLLAFDGHNGDPVRPAVVGTFRAADDADGLYADVDLNGTPEAERLHHAARTGAAVAVSMEFATDAEGSNFTLGPDSPATVTGLAILDRDPGAFQTAQVTLAAGKAPIMSDTPNDPAPEPEPGPEPDEVAGELRAEMAAMERRVLAAQVGGRTSSRHPLAEFEDFESLVTAARTTRDHAAAEELSGHFTAGYRRHSQRVRIARQFGAALVDQVTADNLSLVQPHMLTEVYGRIDQERRVITALGGPSSIGSSGMTVNWPTFTGDLTAIVAAQTAEKAPINSVKISFGSANEPLVTYAAGSDISFQLATRSQPPYLQLHNRVLNSAYNLTTDGVMAAALVDEATGYVAWTPAAATGEDTAKAVMAASIKVDKATGSPASVIVAGEAAFSAIAVAFWSHAPAYGTQNTGGTAQASTLAVSVSGIPVVFAPMLDSNTAVVTNGEAASWGEAGPALVTAVDVERLGNDVAIWGLGAPLVFTPGGVVVLAATAPVAASGTSADKKGK
jgi:hypothetical protein